MAHVTTFRFRAKPGERGAVINDFQRWEREHEPRAKGFVRAVLASSYDDLDEFSAIVVFESKQSYDANSNSPEQSTWYQEFRQHIVDDPEWFNGNLEVQTTS